MINWRKKFVSRFNCIFIQCNPKQNEERKLILLYSDCFLKIQLTILLERDRKHCAPVSYFKLFLVVMTSQIIFSVPFVPFSIVQVGTFLRGAIFSFPLKLIESLERRGLGDLFPTNLALCTGRPSYETKLKSALYTFLVVYGRRAGRNRL